MLALSASLTRSHAVLLARTDNRRTLQRTIAKSHHFTALTPRISTTGRFRHLSKTDLHGGKGKERV
jgi:hypothetical protein